MKTCRLKICGLSRFGDILAANDILPDYIGFVFAESSRRVTPDKAAQLRRELDKKNQGRGCICQCAHGGDTGAGRAPGKGKG